MSSEDCLSEHTFEFIVDRIIDKVGYGCTVHLKLNEESSICSTENITLKFKSRTDVGGLKPGSQVRIHIGQYEPPSTLCHDAFPVAI